MNPYEILEIQPSASPEEIKAAYHKLAKQWHPDRYTGTAKQEAETKFRLLAEAFSQLKDVVRSNAPAPVNRPSQPATQTAQETASARHAKPSTPPSGQGINGPDEWFSEAQRCMEEGDFERASGLAQYAIRLDGSKSEYHAFYAKVLDASGVGDKRAVVQSLLTAIQLNPRDVDSMTMLADQFQSLGMQARAIGIRSLTHNQGSAKQEVTPKKETVVHPATPAPQTAIGSQFSTLLGQIKASLGRFSKRS
jgi:tetratricopeptide (TPR) repeat protein